MPRSTLAGRESDQRDQVNGRCHAGEMWAPSPGLWPGGLEEWLAVVPAEQESEAVQVVSQLRVVGSPRYAS